MMAVDDNRYTELGTITGLANGSNYGVSSLLNTVTFYSFKFESKTKSPIAFDKAYYDIAVEKTEKLNLINESGSAIKYEVDNTEIAEIDAEGNLKAKASGTVNVTATDASGNKAQTVVNCIVMATGIQLANSVLNLRVGETADLFASIQPSNSADKGMTFEVSDPKIIKLNGSAISRRNVEALSVGSATITVKSITGDAVAKCTVKVSEKYQTQTRSANLKVDGAVQKMHKTVWGPNWCQMTKQHSTNDFVTERELAFFKDLKIKSSRGPGGTESNWWLPLEGDAHESASSHMKRGKDLNGFFIEDFYEMPEELDIPVIVNLQVVFHTADDIKEIVRRIRKVTDRTIYLEFGNEYYDTTGMRWFKTCQDYMDRCREYAAAARSIDENVKIGVIILERAMEKRIISDPNNKMKEGDNGIMWGETFIGRIFNWNSIVAQNADVYDAVVPHAYAELANTNGMTQKNLMDHLAASCEEIYEGLLYHSMYFPGKEIWVTEWGSLGGAIFTEKDLEDRARMNFVKLPGQALHHLERLFDMIKAGSVTMASYHTPIDSQGFGLVNGLNNVSNPEDAILPNYHIFKQAGEIIDRNDVFYDLDCTGSGIEIAKLYFTQNVTQDVKNVVGYGFGDENTLKEVLLINHTPDEMVVSIDNLKLKKTWEYGNGSEPFEGWGKKVLKSTWTSMPVVNPDPKTFNGDFEATVTIPPYSAVSADVQADMSAIDAARTLPKTSNAELYKEQNTGDIAKALVLEVNNPIAYSSLQKKQIDLTNDKVVPQIIDDRTFVPIRFIAETIGCIIEYEDGVINISDRGNEIEMTIGSTEAVMNGQPLTLNAAPVVIEDRTLVPVRAVSEMLAKQVYWVDGKYVVVSDQIIDAESEATIQKIRDIFSK